MRLLQADFVYSSHGWLPDAALEVDAYGTVLRLHPSPLGEPTTRYAGLLIPGLVNAHCHLELSHLAGQIPENTGMAGFVQQLIPRRFQTEEKLQVAAADQAMSSLAAAGTVAVGDICNGRVSLPAKRNHPQLKTFSFIELLGRAPQKAAEILEQGKALAGEFAGFPHALSLHAPYSISEALKKAVYASQPERWSIHMLESLQELAWFRDGSGPMRDFFQAFNIPLQAEGAGDPLQFILSGMAPSIPGLLVHNTEMTAVQVQQVAQAFPALHFCLCPRSNQFIHRRLPAFEAFLAYPDRVCLGTDSAASNRSLDIFDEIRFLQKEAPNISLHRLVTWATENGAAALGLSGELGSFREGRRPGINLITHPDPEGPRLSSDSALVKLY
ncbi:MAG: amidohydrolase family protein [Bacteroidota bacterium]